MASSELFQVLRKYVRGQADKYDIERADPSVYRVYENSTRGLTEISFEFKNNSEFLEKLGVSDDDIYFVNVLYSHGGSWGFVDSSQVFEDFKEGYNVFYDLNDENLETFRFILKSIDPGFNYEDLGSEESSNKAAADIFLRIFPTETERIVDDYHTRLERGGEERADEVIDEELTEKLQKHHFQIQNKWYVVKISVGELIMNYLRTGKIWLNFKNFFESLYEEDENAWTSWSDQANEWAYSGNFDKELFNRDVSWQLDKIKDIVEEDQTLSEFVELYDRVTKKFKVGHTYPLPKMKNVEFRIKNFDKETMKIEVVLRSGLKTISRKLSEENFYKLLYQPELFYSEFGSV